MVGQASKELVNNDFKSKLAPLVVRRLTPTRSEVL